MEVFTKMNLNYEKENLELGGTLRATIGTVNRITKHNESFYLRLFNSQTQAVLMNNYQAMEMATGFVPQVNYNNVMSGLAPQLTNRLTRKIVGNVQIEGPDNEENPIDSKFSKYYLNNILTEAFSYSISTGRGLMVVDYNSNTSNTTVRCFDLFRHFLTLNLDGSIKQVDLYVKKADITALSAYTMTERRYFNREGKPCVKNIIVKASWQNERITDTDLIEYAKRDELPPEVFEMFEGIKFYQEIELPFENTLGVYRVDNTVFNNLYPNSKIPMSQFLFIQDLLVENDTTRTYKEIDKHFGRGRVIRPEWMNYGKPANPYEGLPNVANRIYMPQGQTQRDLIFTTYPSKSLEEQKPISVQFDLRTEQWRNEINGVVGDICAAFGLSVLDYDPRLLVTGQRTDDEINALTDITRATVEEKRGIAQKEINDMLSLIGKLNGTTDLFIRWSLSSILNPSKNADLIQKQLAMGVISHEEAVKRSNPDYTKKELQEELNRIAKDRESTQQQVAINNAFEEF